MRETFKKELTEFLSNHRRSAFIGFEVSRHGITESHEGVSIVDMPICEETIVGIAAGMLRMGTAVVVDIMFEAFIFRALDALVNQVLLSFSMKDRGIAPFILRAVGGPFEGAGPQHSALAGEAIRSIPGWEIIAPICADDVHGAFTRAQKANRPMLLLMSSDERCAESHIHILSDGSLRKTRLLKKRGIVVSSRLYCLLVDALRQANLHEEFTVITTALIQPFPWTQLTEVCSDLEQILWITFQQQVDEEKIRAAYLHKMTNRSVDLISVCAECVHAFVASTIVTELTQVLEQLPCPKPHGSQIEQELYYVR
jgi:deoxyxylulose-5-phosphate synthase